VAKGRREIDKEAMFRIIMPSYSSEEEPSRPEPPAPAPGYTEPAPTPAAPAPVPPPQPPAVQAPSPIIGGGVQIHKTGSRILVNIMEYLVIDKLDEAFEKFNNCCKCEKCRQDTAALALNKLPPKYIVVEESKIPIYIAKNNTPEVVPAIVQAILKVKTHPRH